MDVIGIIYGVRLTESEEYRYVGLTTKSASRRLHQHLRNAARGVKTPFYDWIRKTALEDITVDTLETVHSNLSALGDAEISWISRLADRGDRLLNLSAGGLGPTGVEWTTEQREAARERATGRKIPPRRGPENPFFGKKHTLEQREKWSRDRKGSITGENNPNFGRFGEQHPSFGRILSAATRARLSDQKKGDRNPNFGKKDSAETLARKSAAQIHIPKPSSARSAHTRYHTNKGVFKDTCRFCIQDVAELLNELHEGQQND